MSKIYDVVAVTGTYMKDGQEKAKWTNCGAIIKTDKGLSLKLDVIPTEGQGWFKLFEPKPRQQSGTPKSAPPQDEFDDDIPFS